jgi:HK97 gp10 family phage protein
MKIKTDFAQRGRELAKKFEGSTINLQSNLSKKLYTGAEMVQTDAVRMVPVDTGQLKNSIAIKQHGRGTEIAFDIGSLTEYARIVEYGSKFQKAQPYLRPALDMNRSHIKRLVAQAYNEGIF